MGKKRSKGFRKDDKDQPNLKRFRNDIVNLVESSEHSKSQASGSMFDTDKKHVSRKQRRKEERKLKKARRYAHSIGQKMPTLESRMQIKEKKNKEQFEKERKEKMKEKRTKAKEKRKQRQSEKKKMEEERRKEAVLEDIKREEKMLKHLEKQLHLNKRKSKNLPQSFIDDGLDYLLDVVDENKMSDLYNEGAESDLEDLIEEDEENSDDEDDGDSQEMNLAGDKSRVDKLAQKILKLSETSEKINDKNDNSSKMKKIHFEEEEVDDGDTEEDDDYPEEEDSEQESEDDNEDDFQDEGIDDELNEDNEIHDKKQDDDDEVNDNEDNIDDSDADDNEDDDSDDVEDDNNDDTEEEEEANKALYKEDIYGRLRDEEGNIVHNPTTTGVKYVPPGKRLQLAIGDQKKKLQLERLKKQLKGLVNRASESNMQAICSQIETVYLGNSRADVTETLSMIIIEAVVSPSLTPERLVMEMVMLLTVLHGNVGNEIGATFLEHLAHKFDELCNHGNSYGEGKEMDNVVLLMSNMYNFKVIHSLLIIDVIRKFIASFMEKDVELLLLILKNVGFTLRKDDAIALKDIILEIQSKAVAMDTSKSVDQSRVRFMLDTLLAIKNNNMRKIPNYDPELTEQLKKSTRNILRGSTLGDGQLRIGLEDLLHAENKGKWWIVGSAWEGRDKGDTPDTCTTKVTSSVIDGMSSKILQLAQKQRMNTDIRRNIFCVMMTAEDYIDAFEKLMRLGLKNQQEREIIHVIIDSCQQEKTFNPFYAFLMQKFCECDRRFQMTFQFTLWDKFKEMGNLSEHNRSNLAKLVTYLLTTKAQSLSIFKVVEFGTLDTAMVRFMKEVLIGLLLDHPDDTCEAVFLRIAPLSKLQMLHEGLKLFMQHFLLRKKSKDIPADPKLKDRVSMAIKCLSAGQSKMLL